MGRFVQVFFVAATIIVSVVVYALKFDTGRDAVAIAELKREIAREKDNLSVLRAEWSLLNQPDRLQRLAKKYLDLKPLKPAQPASLDKIVARPDTNQLDALILQALGATAEIAAAPRPAPMPPRKP